MVMVLINAGRYWEVKRLIGPFLKRPEKGRK
jgi:hypothetical protein